MNRADAQARIIRNLAVIAHEASLLAANGQNRSTYAEQLIRDSLNAAHGRGWVDLNATQFNTPAIDLLSADGSHGIQATLGATKQKFDKTSTALKKVLMASAGKLSGLTHVEVVGLTCVRNPKITAWSTLPGHHVQVRAIDLLRRLDLTNLGNDQLADVDDVMQNAATNGPFHVNSDGHEMQTIIAYLDRPAIRHARPMELQWRDMEDAMKSIRRLLAQGADDSGRQITRPYRTFQPHLRTLLYEIYSATSQISALLANELRVRGTMTESEGTRIDGYRLRIQEAVTELAAATGLKPPEW